METKETINEAKWPIYRIMATRRRDKLERAIALRRELAELEGRLDANGRPIEVGDIVAKPYDNSDLAELPERIKDAILGQVIKVFTEIEGYLIVDSKGKRITATEDLTEAVNTLNLYQALDCDAKGQRIERAYVHLGDGITYKASEIVTLGGLEWVTCQECGFSWPFDARMNTVEECPCCRALLQYPYPLGGCN
jgi:hypothetical protein